jgi:hypothetical protein
VALRRIDTPGTLDDLDKQAAEVWAELRSRAAGLPEADRAELVKRTALSALECQTLAVELEPERFAAKGR